MVGSIVLFKFKRKSLVWFLQFLSNINLKIVFTLLFIFLDYGVIIWIFNNYNLYYLFLRFCRNQTNFFAIKEKEWLQSQCGWNLIWKQQWIVFQDCRYWVIGHPSMPHCFFGYPHNDGSRIQCSRNSMLCSGRTMLLLLAALFLCASAQTSYFGEDFEELLSSDNQYSRNAQYSSVCPSGDDGAFCTCSVTEMDCEHVQLSQVPAILESTIQRL